MVNEAINTAENPAMGKSGHCDAVFYDIRIEDLEIKTRLVSIFRDIAKLEEEKRGLTSELLKKADAPKGWDRSIKEVSEYGYITARISRIVTRKPKESPPAPAYTPPAPRPESPLEKLTRHIDPKVLFNSGILTKEEKRKLLGIDEICGNTPAANG